MKIGDLRNIGRTLFREIGFYRTARCPQQALGTGAGGDRTFPIDRRAEEIVFAGLESLGEPLTVISEEAGIFDMRGGGARVIIDPVDGSKNAISGIPFYCASIATADGERLADISMSYVINLLTGDEFWAEKGKGAFLNEERIRSQSDDEFYLIAYEAPCPARDIPLLLPLLSRGRKGRCFGATALDLAHVASGAISVFVTPSPSRSFDFAGGWLLVREAGGTVTDTNGREIGGVILGISRSTPLLAAGNQGLLEKALQYLGVAKTNV